MNSSQANHQLPDNATVRTYKCQLDGTGGAQWVYGAGSSTMNDCADIRCFKAQTGLTFALSSTPATFTSLSAGDTFTHVCNSSAMFQADGKSTHVYTCQPGGVWTGVAGDCVCES